MRKEAQPVALSPGRFGCGIPRSPCRNSSKAEQAICNGQVVGSIPAFGSKGYAQAYSKESAKNGGEAKNMTAIDWYIVRLERLAASWLFRHYGRSTPGKVPSLKLNERTSRYMMRFHSAATGD